MSTTELLVRSVRTRAVLGVLPWATLSYETRANSAGSLDATVAAAELNLTDLLLPGRVMIAAIRDGRPVWSGLLWKRSIAPEGLLTLQAGEILSYWDRRRLRTNDLAFTQVDQALILSALIAQPQAVPNGNLGVEQVGVRSTGVLRDRYYLAVERKTYGESIRQLLGVIGGCDLISSPIFRSGVLVDRFEVSYPRVGRSVADSRVVWLPGTNCRLDSWEEDASATASLVDAIGATATSGGPPLLAGYEAPAMYGAGWPMLNEAISYTDVSELPTLQQKAQADLSARAGVILSVKLAAFADTDPAYGTYGLGDDVRLIVPPGPVFRSGYDLTLRIGAIKVTAGQADQVAIELVPTILDSGLFTGVGS